MQIEIVIGLAEAGLTEGARDKFKSKNQMSENDRLVRESHLADTKSK